MGKPSHGFRTPSAAVAFVEGQAPSLQSVQPASPPGAQPAGRRKTVQRADGRTLRKQTVYLPPDLSRRLSVYCAEHDRDISDVVAQAIAGLLDG